MKNKNQLKHSSGFKTLSSCIVLLLVIVLEFCSVMNVKAFDTLHTKQIAEDFFLKYEPKLARNGYHLADEVSRVYPSAFQTAEVAGVHVYTKGNMFVVVSATDRLPAILGYGERVADAERVGESSFVDNDHVLPQGLLSILNAYAVVAEGGTRATNDVFLPQGKNIPALLTTVRHQEAPYNAACPYVMLPDSTLSDERTVVGCLATALEQIITYHGRDVVLQDTLHGWETPSYIIDDVLPGAHVDVGLILDNYDAAEASEAAIDAVSRLSYYCGVAVRMNWGLSESGAQLRNFVDPLQRAFGWGYVHYADSYRYAPSDWVSMIVAELEAGRPILYAGYTSQLQGHAFVVDGLNENGLFHVNWGYGGHYDGYFRLDVLAAYENQTDRLDENAVQGFFCNQEMIMLHPDALVPALPDTIHRYEGDVVVDSIVVEREPIVGIYTPISVYVRNLSEKYLTTPFELLTNLPTDTLRFEQADYIALSGVTLQPGESRKLHIDACFTYEGERILSISPDDVCLLYECPVKVLPAGKSKLSFSVSEPVFNSPTSVSIIVEARNSKSAEARCGELYRAFFDEGDTCRNYAGATQKASFLYLAPGESRVDTFTYDKLNPEEVYTFRMAYSWHTVKQLVFAMPEAAGIHDVIYQPLLQGIYTLDGRKLEALPQRRGVYIQDGKKILVR